MSNLDLLRNSLQDEKVEVYKGGKLFATSISNYADQKKYLSLAISDQIIELQTDLNRYPGWLLDLLPGVASKENKKDKMLALEGLQLRISHKTASIEIEDFDNQDVLDGVTLELFQYAIRIYPHLFTNQERSSLLQRGTTNRLARVFGGCV
jgi:hypothetical protein